MRVRKMDVTGDYQFGHGRGDFWRDQVEGVGQILKTRLGLFTGEWFLDKFEGTPWGGFPLNDDVVALGRILASHTETTRDVAIKTRILQTQGVLSITDYASNLDSSTRKFTASMKVDTIYGAAFLKITPTETGFEIGVTPLGGGPL